MLAMILRRLRPVGWVLNGGWGQGLRAMREAVDWHEALLRVEYSFQSEHLVSHCILFLCLCWPEIQFLWSVLFRRETLATRLLVVKCLAKPWIARWWPSVQKAKIAGQPTSSLLLRWWCSWKVLAMRTLRANLRAHLTSWALHICLCFVSVVLALELLLLIFLFLYL